MKSNHLRTYAFALAVPGGAAGFLLRRWQLRQAAELSGRVVGGASTLLLTLLCAVLTLLLAWGCSRLRKESAYEAVFSSSLGQLIGSVAAAALLLIASAVQLMEGLSGLRLVICFLGLAASFCFAITGAQRFRGVVPPVAIHVLPCLYLVVRLIVDFRQWSLDPAVLDYCFELFAAISAMCAVYHIGTFCYDDGRRRICAFWCMAAVLFSAVSLADGGALHTLQLAGAGLWAGVNGWQLLESG